ncbi:lipoprotein [Streptomyces davaonensis JCM 4913]|uniref:Lipoprotein n=1 Tax=Streptomyces davaonensis (strain DSM 101723 / JCM 4913 / KCC S-0913 / 768) TaxID=1214101 RepID=K4QVZ0_STRDJ|nr:hypothetical protein [Streptomyces davaonensis]CCK24985.1 lipoprotein [Streptomyces davaonensis JCM 4913]
MKHSITNRVTAALLCAATSVVITGCGPDGKGTGASGNGHPFDSMTPEQIDGQARAALKGASSMRWTGEFNSDGRHVEVDVAADDHGSCNGTFGLDFPMHIIKKGSLVYVKAEEEYWRTSFSRGMTPEQTEEMVAQFKGRWIKPPKLMSQTLGSMCDIFHTQVEDLSLASDGNPTREADTTVHGRPVAVLTDSTTTGTTTVYVAKKGKPYPLRITVTGGDEPLDVTLTDQGKPVDTTPPPPDEILDPTTLSP